MNTTLNFELLENLLEELKELLPKVLGVVLFALLGWISLKIILFVVKKALKLTKIDELASRFNENNQLFNSSFKIQPTKIIVAFIKWFLILVAIIVGADIFGLTMVSGEVSKLVGYLPHIFSALLIFIFGVYGASLLKNSMQSMLKTFDLNGSKSISSAVFYLLLVIVCIIALNQAGIDTTIITNNVFLILGAFFATFSIAFGLGSRDIILRLVLGFYSRKNFEIGKRIQIDEIEGIVVSIDNICMVIATEEKKVVIPIKQISNKKVEILD